MFLSGKKKKRKRKTVANEFLFRFSAELKIFFIRSLP